MVRDRCWPRAMQLPLVFVAQTTFIECTSKSGTLIARGGVNLTLAALVP
jgi:hypothetical protein